MPRPVVDQLFDIANVVAHQQVGFMFRAGGDQRLFERQLQAQLEIVRRQRRIGIVDVVGLFGPLVIPRIAELEIHVVIRLHARAKCRGAHKRGCDEQEYTAPPHHRSSPRAAIARNRSNKRADFLPKRHLVRWYTKAIAGEYRRVFVEMQRAARPFETRGQQLGEHAGAAHAFMELRIVIPAVAALSHQAHHMGGP
jgi:hypothetical protein